MLVVFRRHMYSGLIHFERETRPTVLTPGHMSPIISENSSGVGSLFCFVSSSSSSSSSSSVRRQVERDVGQTNGRSASHADPLLVFGVVSFSFYGPGPAPSRSLAGDRRAEDGWTDFCFFFLLSKKKFSHFLSLSGHYRTKPSVDQRRSFLNSSLHGLAAAKQVALSSFFLSYLSSTFGAFFILRSLSDGFAVKEKRRKGDIAFSFASLHSFFHSCLNSVLIESIRLE